MNERIDKLFEQALEEFKAENKYATIIVPNPLKEKFAELIVRECIDTYDHWATHSMDKTAFVVARTHVKEHFGIEQ
jgi:hypothetical protein